MCSAPAVLQVGALPRHCTSFSASAGCTPTERTCSVLVWKFKTAIAAADLAPAPEHSSSDFGRFVRCFETSDSFTHSTSNFNANSVPLLKSPRHAWRQCERSAPSPLSCPQQVQHPGQAVVLVVSKQSNSVRARIAFARRNPEQTMLPQGAAAFWAGGFL